MKATKAIPLACLCLAGACALPVAPVLAEPPGTQAPARMMRGPAQDFDWIEHTQSTLDELKVKLNLAPGQAAAWDAWSGGVLKDARKQLEQRKKLGDQRPAEDRAPPREETTPESMARGIARLRTHTAWMQEHLAELEAAQVRTKTFYDALDTNQKTIFDLFWHEMHHRSVGHDEGWEMGERDSYGRGWMREEYGGGMFRP